MRETSNTLSEIEKSVDIGEQSLIQYRSTKWRKPRRVTKRCKKDVDNVSKVLHNINIDWPGPKAEKHKSARERESD